MKRGFTLLELIVVVIIIGVLVSLALPAYFRGVERARSAEGVALLGTLRSAEIRYYASRDVGVWTTTESELDVGFTAKKFFTTTVGASNSTLVKAMRIAGGPLGQYNLSIDVDGTISCTGGSTGACAQLGY